MSIYFVLRAFSNSHFQTEGSQLQQMGYNFSFGDSYNCHFTNRPHTDSYRSNIMMLPG